MSFQTNAEYQHLFDGYFLARLTSVYTLTSSDVQAGATYAGMTAGTNLYSFVEQTLDPKTGLPIDAQPGRRSYPVAPSVPTSAFAIEDNNASIPMPGSTPTGFTNPGPYVQVRSKGTVNSVQVYQFSYSAPSTPAASQSFAIIKAHGLANPSSASGVLIYPALVVPSGNVPAISLTQVESSATNGWVRLYTLGGLSSEAPSPYFWYPVISDAGDVGMVETAGPDGKPIYRTELQSPYSYVQAPNTFTDHPGDLGYGFGGIVYSAYNLNAPTSELIAGPGWFSFGTLPSGTWSGGSNVATVDLYINAPFPQNPSATAYKGATGTDSIGNQFVSGLNVAIGSGLLPPPSPSPPPPPSSVGTVDGGTWT